MRTLQRFGFTLLILFSVLHKSSSLWAQDEYAYISTQVGLGTQFSPDVDTTAVYGWHGGLFLSERWIITFLWQRALLSPASSRTGLGLEFIFAPHERLTPYFGMDFVYQYQATTQLGARISAGAELNIDFVTGIDNLRLRSELAFTQLFADNAFNADSRLDLPSLAVAWHF